MEIAGLVVLAWFAVSIPASIVIGGLLRGDDRELIAVDGERAVYLMPDGSVAQAPLPARAAA